MSGSRSRSARPHRRSCRSDLRLGRAIAGPASNGSWAATALAGAKPAVFWTDRGDAPEAAPVLQGEMTADLTVVGAGLTGLGTALLAMEQRPGLEVVVLEAERCGEMVRKKPFRLPPEPLRWAAVQMTRKAIQRSDRREGRRGARLWLLDRCGVGFDS